MIAESMHDQQIYALIGPPPHHGIAPKDMTLQQLKTMKAYFDVLWDEMNLRGLEATDYELLAWTSNVNVIKSDVEEELTRRSKTKKA